MRVKMEEDSKIRKAKRESEKGDSVLPAYYRCGLDGSDPPYLCLPQVIANEPSPIGQFAVGAGQARRRPGPPVGRKHRGVPAPVVGCEREPSRLRSAALLGLRPVLRPV